MVKKALFLNSLLISVLVLTSCQKATNDPSLFQKWKVSSLLKNGASIVQNASDTLSLTFDQNKSLSIQLEINSCGADFSLRDKTLDIDLIACTEACCDSDFSADLLYVLQHIVAYHFTGNDLNLTGDSDRVIRCIPFD